MLLSGCACHTLFVSAALADGLDNLGTGVVTVAPRAQGLASAEATGLACTVTANSSSVRWTTNPAYIINPSPGSVPVVAGIPVTVTGKLECSDSNNAGHKIFGILKFEGSDTTACKGTSLGQASIDADLVVDPVTSTLSYAFSVPVTFPGAGPYKLKGCFADATSPTVFNQVFPDFGIDVSVAGPSGGGGGCSLFEGTLPIDPILPLLLALAFAACFWRARHRG